MSRALLIVGILMAMLIIPVWLNKEREDKLKSAEKARATTNSASSTAGNKVATPTAPLATAVAAEGPRPIGFGLTFVAAPNDANMPADVASIGCHGEPAPLDQPHQSSCNPYKGDTSCRTVLPVLCLKPGHLAQLPGVKSDFYHGWTGATLSATQPVMGAILESEVIASARCEKELGAGWRMAEFHDGQGGWGLLGVRGTGLGSSTRYWVHINDQGGNCWNSAS